MGQFSIQNLGQFWVQINRTEHLSHGSRRRVSANCADLHFLNYRRLTFVNVTMPFEQVKTAQPSTGQL
jgi:hypothetical protein